MKILKNITELKKALEKKRSLGFVPTMGSIHEGHTYLISKSLKECREVIVSIFINPTQFNNRNDLKRYPKNIKKDLNVIKKFKVNFVFIPKIRDIYNFKRKEKISINKKDLILCAKHRKGHFEGVLDVMDRLTNIVNPSKIYMGEKDFQQYFLVKKFLEKRYPTKVIKCKTVRDQNNIAFSSRNLLLSEDSLNKASNIVSDIKIIKKKLLNKSNINSFLKTQSQKLTKKYKIKIEYLELRNLINLSKTNNLKNSRIFFAYYLDGIRLIDNL